MTHSAIVAVY